MEVNPATTSTLKRSAFHIREFPRFTVGHFLVVKLTTVRRWRGKPPKKNHITGTPSQKKMWPPKKRSLEHVKLYTWVEETRETPLFGSSVFPVSNGIFFGAVGLFLGCKKLLKWCRWMKVRQRFPMMCSMTSGPILRKMLPFWKVGGSNVSQKMPTLNVYNQMMGWQ